LLFDEAGAQLAVQLVGVLGQLGLLAQQNVRDLLVLYC
jgi:hypothetical protein